MFVCAILNECRNHHKHQYLDLWLTQWVFSVRLLMLNIWSPQYWRFIMSLIFSSILLLRSPLGHTHNISHNFKISEIHSCISNVAHLNTYCTSRIKTLLSLWPFSQTCGYIHQNLAALPSPAQVFPQVLQLVFLGNGFPRWWGVGQLGLRSTSHDLYWRDDDPWDLGFL